MENSWRLNYIRTFEARKKAKELRKQVKTDLINNMNLLRNSNDKLSWLYEEIKKEIKTCKK